MMKKFISTRLIASSVLCIGALLSIGLAPAPRLYGGWQFPQENISLPVKPILQSEYTSCGEAVIVMAYNYAYPEMPITEQSVIDYAVAQKYYTEHRLPFTSPDNMVNIANHYADTVLWGQITDQDEGLEWLEQNLARGNPIVIDVIARLYDPRSSAHFVVITGILVDSDNPNGTKIYFNDPLTGTNRWGYWLGGEGVWNAWQNNGDPGGQGWWMTISSP